MKQAIKAPVKPPIRVVDSVPRTRASVDNMPGATFGGIFGNVLHAIWTHRQRSILTMLGIIIGIGAFISVVTLSQGATDRIVSQYTFLATIITIDPSQGSVTTANPFMLTSGDVQALGNLPHLTGISPIISNTSTVIYGKQGWNTSVQGVSYTYQSMQSTQMIMGQGNWWDESEDQGRRSVAVLGSTTATNLFGTADPIGQTIRIDRDLYKVVGVLQATGGRGGSDNGVYVPYTRLLNPSVPNQIQSVIAQVDDTSNLDSVSLEMQVLLEQRHHIIPGAKDGFDITEAITELQQGEQQLSILSTLMISIATFSLVVGGVGIMNMMLVSVTERTREIGLRSALGAQPIDISLQFLLEALMLSLIGGAAGLLFGLLLAYAITSLVGFPFLVSASSFLLGFGVATAIGVGFGLYPAIRASRLDPIIALRSA
jgi:putative ABC transport system permease protein